MFRDNIKCLVISHIVTPNFLNKKFPGLTIFTDYNFNETKMHRLSIVMWDEQQQIP